ncbi:carbon-nitrogen hydrolase family protein [Desulfosporosinus metallidurans]|uniref:Aliphatic amidase AmiE n=1 Tax=Desulfosporosinus metallidurans TaxID=1888891 RepID=A0A1Q8R033_9FIRM|nr:carbon-nitrogen hydrolase family protein [Desulfosporosinus metallidurans]OLN32989.1 Aliphatic amidase AmiE [Desulfosporosinus metallidurans]
MPFQLVMAQLVSLDDKHVNLKKAENAVKYAKQIHGADIVVFPEVFMSHFPIGTPKDISLKDAEPVDGPFVGGMCKLALQYGVWLVFGMREATEEPSDERVYNTTVIVSSEGSVISTYRKTHLFDAFGYNESKNIKPGDALFEPISTPFGKLGLFVCYELRFPEIARYQAIHGAEIIIVPSGWVHGPMKEYHWRNLVTARAIENTVYMVACGKVSDNFYIGQSLIADPMGVIMVSGPETEALIPCRIDLGRIKGVRAKLPSYLHRRPELYTSMNK